jgi:predicted metal-dependent enzyme (double-stranded beta helix superfamily)
MQKLYQASDLTILNVIWAPWMTLLPHNHQMWAVIGIYTGREDNIFWRRRPVAEGRKLEAAGAKALCEKDVVPLGRDIIHSVPTQSHASPEPFMSTVAIFSVSLGASGTRKPSRNKTVMDKRCYVASKRQMHLSGAKSEGI